MPSTGDISVNKNRCGLCLYGAHSLVEKKDWNLLKPIQRSGSFKFEQCPEGGDLGPGHPQMGLSGKASLREGCLGRGLDRAQAEEEGSDP